MELGLSCLYGECNSENVSAKAGARHAEPQCSITSGSRVLPGS